MAGRDNPETPSLEPPPSWATWALVGLNVLVGIAMLLSGVSAMAGSPTELVAAGAVDAPLVWHGELWRLVTACFVHVGVWHLGLNMWVMFQVGQTLEDLVGGARTALIYLASGVFGFACSVMLQPRITTGASGAVFGVVGALIAVAVLVERKKIGRMLLGALVPFVGATLLLGVLLPMVDNTAHVGGLVMGFLLGYGLQGGEASAAAAADGPGEPAANKRLGRERTLGMISLVAAGLLFVVGVGYAARPLLSPRYHAIEGLAALAASGPGKLEVARKHRDHAAAMAPADAATLVLAGRVLEETPGPDGAPRGPNDAARASHSAALRMIDDDDPSGAFDQLVIELALHGGEGEQPYSDPRTVWALCDAAISLAGERPAPLLKNNCAWLLIKAGDPRTKNPQRAVELARAAVKESEARVPAVVHTYAVALGETGDPAEGVAWLERLAVQGQANALLPLSLEAERARLARLIPVPAPASTPAASPASVPTSADGDAGTTTE